MNRLIDRARKRRAISKIEWQIVNMKKYLSQEHPVIRILSSFDTYIRDDGFVDEDSYSDLVGAINEAKRMAAHRGNWDLRILCIKAEKYSEELFLVQSDDGLL